MKTINHILTKTLTIFLSFDDGPDPKVTPALLELLDDLDAKGTFFVVGERALRYQDLTRWLLERGNAIGDHSWDHKFKNFFRSDAQLRAWIERGQRELSAVIGQRPLGFRSPAGVKTPPLRRVLTQLAIPCIHWNKRFFDTNFIFNPKRAARAAEKLHSGDILLLHDGNCPDPNTFLDGVTTLINLGKQRGFQFRALTPSDLELNGLAP